MMLLSSAQVLELIEPVDPDNLQPTGSGTWLAKWAPPILEGDLEALRRTPGIEIIQERELFSGWLAVEFRIDPAAAQASP